MRAKILDIQKNHLSLTLNNLISVIVPTSDIDSSKYELKQVEVQRKTDLTESEEDLEVPDPEMDEMDGDTEAGKASRWELWHVKKEKGVERGAKVKVEVKKIIVNQDKFVLYASMQ